MTATPKAEQRRTPSLQVAKSLRHWLLFVHQLPPSSSSLRVRTWRRLQQIGAIPVKQAVYALPDTPNAREDLEWLKIEVAAAGGDAIVFAADNIDAWSDDALIEEFRRSRQEAYATLARHVEQVLKRATSSRRSTRTRATTVRRRLAMFQGQLTALENIDFFGAAGRDRVTTLLTRLEEHTSGRGVAATAVTRTGPSDPERYRGRLWVTRPRPGVDRMASAWLIRRFIDPQARFGFAANREAAPTDARPFDMFGVEFSHRGQDCTFETLCDVFAVQQPAVARIAAIVHDLDLKDNRFGAPEAVTVGNVIEGLQFAHADDDTLLAQGMVLFESLYRSFDRSARAAGPRPVAKPRNRRRSKPVTTPRRRRARQ